MWKCTPFYTCCCKLQDFILIRVLQTAVQRTSVCGKAAARQDCESLFCPLWISNAAPPCRSTVRKHYLGCAMPDPGKGCWTASQNEPGDLGGCPGVIAPSSAAFGNSPLVFWPQLAPHKSTWIAPPICVEPYFLLHINTPKTGEIDVAKAAASPRSYLPW